MFLGETTMMYMKKSKNKTRISASVAIVLLIAIIVAMATGCTDSNNGTTPQSHDSEPEASLVMVPDLRGYSIEAMALEFSNLGLMPSLVMLISDEPVDTVLFIERMGQLTQVPSTIEVFISGGIPEFESEIPSEYDDPSPQHQQAFGRMEFGGIDWLILDEEENRVLLLSEFSLFDRTYNAELMPVTWETSEVRNYLNNEFFYSFSPEERELIAETRVINDDVMATFGGLAFFGVSTWSVPAGNDTDDRIFLLSQDEVRKYFTDSSARVVRRLEDDDWLPGGDWVWALRSPGINNFQNLAIVPTGAYIGYPTFFSFGVRPALWLYTNYNLEHE